MQSMPSSCTHRASFTTPLLLLHYSIATLSLFLHYSFTTLSLLFQRFSRFWALFLHKNWIYPNAHRTFAPWFQNAWRLMLHKRQKTKKILHVSTILCTFAAQFPRKSVNIHPKFPWKSVKIGTQFPWKSVGIVCNQQIISKFSYSQGKQLFFTIR